MIDWNSDTWGQPGTNVHYAENGSWVTDKHTETEAADQ